MAAEYSLFFDLGLIVVVATLFSFVAKRLKQPNLVAYIFAGIFLGPVLLLLKPFLGGFAYSIPLEEIRVFSDLGIAFLLFSVGIETDFAKLKDYSRTIVFGTILQTILTILFVVSFASFFVQISLEEAIYLGVILSFSSTMVVVKLLSDRFQISTMQGRLMIGFLLMQDVLAILLIPVVSNLNLIFSWNFLFPFFLAGIILISIAYLLNRYFYPKIFEFSSESNELLYLLALSCCFVFLFISFILKIPLALGSFVAGVSLSSLPFNLQILNIIKGLRDFFVTIFFVTLGMQLTFSFSAFPILFILFVLMVVFIAKPLIFYAITLFEGYGGKIAVLVAVGLGQVSEFSFILASEGLKLNLLSKELFSLSIFVIAFSMVVTPYFFNNTGNIYNFLNNFTGLVPARFKKQRFYRKIAKLEDVQKMSEHIVVFGAGTMGTGVATALYNAYPLVIVGYDPKTVSNLLKHGVNAIYGAPDNESIWHKVNLAKAKLLVVTVPDEKNIELIRYAKKINPKIVVFARAQSQRDAAKLYLENVEFVCMPAVLGANIFIKNVIKFLETGSLSDVNNLEMEFMLYLKDEAKDEPKEKPAVPEN